MTVEERTQLRKALQKYYGAFTEVARKAEVTPSMVSKVLRSERNSDTVLACAAEVLNERTQRQAMLIDRARTSMQRALQTA